MFREFPIPGNVPNPIPYTAWFYVQENDDTWVLLNVQYLNSTLSPAGTPASEGSLADGVIIYNADTGDIRKTADGAKWFGTVTMGFTQTHAV